MIAATAQKQAACSARLSADGRRIILGPGPAEWSDLCQSLPAARWNQYDCRWTCDCTPAAAWRICCRGEACPTPELARIADAFAEQLRASGRPQHIVSKTPAWRHQRAAYERAYPLDAAMLAMAMGTGKTKVAVDLCVNWHCQTILILCPLSVRGVWKREIDRHAGRPIAICLPTRGSTKTKTEATAATLRAAVITKTPTAVIINYDTAKLEPFASWSLGREWDCVILDESHRAKAHNSLTSRYCAKLGRVAKRRLCLSGTPLAQSPLDVFGQFRFLDPGLFGTSWHHFSNRYAIKGNPYIPQQITGYKNQYELQERMALITYRCRAEDVLDLPEAMHEERTFELSPAACKAYRQLEEELIADLGAGVVTASNALVRLLRLQQCTSGFLCEDETQKIHRLDGGKELLLTDIIEDAGGEPLVVFCRFRPDLDSVRHVCESLGLRYGELSGAEKSGLTDRGEMSPEIDVLGAQIQSGGLGVDLTRARIAVYYSLGFSLCEYEQSLARLHRPGQTRNVVYYHLIAENTVDRRVYAALRARKDVIEAVLEGMQ
jgi:SNF2 family DNA or RNA helicase